MAKRTNDHYDLRLEFLDPDEFIGPGLESVVAFVHGPAYEAMTLAVQEALLPRGSLAEDAYYYPPGFLSAARNAASTLLDDLRALAIAASLGEPLRIARSQQWCDQGRSELFALALEGGFTCDDLRMHFYRWLGKAPARAERGSVTMEPALPAHDARDVSA